jgi:uncharacterized protein YbbC (DUF1343 family)
MSGDGVKSGLDVLLAEDCARLRGRRVGLLVHPAAVDRRLRHAVPLLHASLGRDLRCLFGPQHGIRGETQDNMVEWEGFAEPTTGLPVFSLYGRHRQPTSEMLDGIDVLVIDLQDVGARYYTFVWTLLLCLEACAAAGKQVIVLDRPNPLSGRVEGNVLDPAFRSFVGLEPVPMRHGLTIGELAAYLRDRRQLDVDLSVVEMEGWRRRMWFDETGLPWVMPSPNLPTLASATLYPGFCLLEGTELSEGRGTTRPFEICGAPYVEPERLVAWLRQWALPGCTLRPLWFEPTFQKHVGQVCGGCQVHVTDRTRFQPVLTATAVLAAVRQLWPERFAWRQPPYEYETEKLPIDILAGTDRYRAALDEGREPTAIVADWAAARAAFQEGSRDYLRYA